MEMLMNQSLVVMELINPEIHTVLNSQLPSRTYLEERDQSGRDRTFFLPSKMEI